MITPFSIKQNASLGEAAIFVGNEAELSLVVKGIESYGCKIKGLYREEQLLLFFSVFCYVSLCTIINFFSGVKINAISL